ncbi:MAG TPA: TonB-dependent receptor [Bryobacteraceae bacterium]|nr:TonB-dependent receptor [Bryobacteraceae bacterium]
MGPWNTRFVFLAASGLLSLAPLIAQEALLSNIRGVVLDQKNAVISGAVVRLRNQNTGLERASRTDDTGNYLFNNIVPGMYAVTAEFPGFKRYSQTDIDLTASRTVRVDITLEVGELTQTVEVSGVAPVIETETPTVSFSARNDIMNRVPTAGSVQGGRIPYAFFYMVPGNVMSVGSASFNGLPSAAGATRLTLDGVRVAESCCQIVPTLEMLDEMKVVTHNASAEYATPSTVQMVTRQGTNAFHGDAWWLFDDKSLQARNPFLTEKQVFHGHTFVWSVGGPIVKNKLFFYHGFEGVRLNNISVTASPFTPNNLPTPAMQRGDFSELLDPSFVNQFNRGQTVTVRDPLTGTPFSNNVIPSNRISSVSNAFIERFWTAPTGAGIVNNQFTNALRPFRRDKADIRVDYNISPRHTVFGRYGHTYLTVALPTTPFTQENSSNLSQIFPGRSVSISDTFVVNPRITNEFRFGFTRTRLAFSSPFEREDVMAAAGLQGTLGITGLPGLNFTGSGAFTGIAARSFTQSTNQVTGVTDHISVFSGAHSIKAGIQFNRAQIFSNNLIGPPAFTFDGRLSGWSFADFLLGYPSTATRQLAPNVFYLFQNEWGFFVQDEIRLNQQLTLTAGLRYQIWPFVHEKYDKLAVFDVQNRQIVIPSEEARRFIVPNFPQSTIPVRTAEEANYAAKNRELIKTYYGAIAPRFGFAWRPFNRGNTVIRGGYGIYYYNTTGATGVSPTGSVFLGSQTVTQQLGTAGTLTPTIAFPNPFTGFGAVGSLNPETLGFGATVANLRNPMVQEYSVSIEREFRGWGVRGSYLGFLQTRIPIVVNYNEAPPSNQPFSQSRRPVPLVRDINLTNNGGFTRNNGLQFELKRPTVYGFFLSAGYTYMKALTDVNADFGGNTPFVPLVGTGGNYGRRERFTSNPNFTPRQQLILTYSYELPFGRGKRFGSRWHPFVNGALGGWRTVGVTMLQSGRYLTPFYVGVDPAGSTPGTASHLPDRIGDGNLPREDRGAFTGMPFFDTGAFACPGGSSINGQANLLTAGCPLSTPENVGRYGNSSPTIIQGPGINTWNLSVIKEFVLPREGTSIEFAAQIANPWNHPSWEASPNMNLSSPATVGRYASTRNDFIEPFSYGNRKITLQFRFNF